MTIQDELFQEKLEYSECARILRNTKIQVLSGDQERYEKALDKVFYMTFGDERRPKNDS